MTKAVKGWNKFLSDFKIDRIRYDKIIGSFAHVRSHVDNMVSGKDYWQVSTDELAYIFAATKLLKASKVVETGIGPGTSSFAILDALKEVNGKLYSFDLGVSYGESDTRPVGFVVPQDMRSKWTITLGNSKETLIPVLNRISPIDIFFHDSDHSYNHVMFELKTASKYLIKDGLIMVDNYDWSDAPVDFSKENGYELVPIVDDLAFLYKL